MSEYKGAEFQLDLAEMFTDFPANDRALKQAIGGEVIDTIIKRTLSGVDVDGNKFVGYSADYVRSLAFKAAGKSKSRVDLKESGDMLYTMDLLSDVGTKLNFGWEDELQQAKAHNHNVGDTVPKRSFLGLSEKERKQIIEKFQPEVDKSISRGAAQTAFEKKALSFLDKVLARFRDV